MPELLPGPLHCLYRLLVCLLYRLAVCLHCLHHMPALACTTCLHCLAVCLYRLLAVPPESLADLLYIDTQYLLYIDTYIALSQDLPQLPFPAVTVVLGQAECDSCSFCDQPISAGGIIQENDALFHENCYNQCQQQKDQARCAAKHTHCSHQSIL